MKANNIGINSISREHYGTSIEIGFTVDDGHGEQDQVLTRVTITYPNKEADAMLGDLLAKIDKDVQAAIANHLQEPIWEQGCGRRQRKVASA